MCLCTIYYLGNTIGNKLKELSMEKEMLKKLNRGYLRDLVMEALTDVPEGTPQGFTRAEVALEKPTLELLQRMIGDVEAVMEIFNETTYADRLPHLQEYKEFLQEIIDGSEPTGTTDILNPKKLKGSY